jgi:hypothetical protein
VAQRNQPRPPKDAAAVGPTCFEDTSPTGQRQRRPRHHRVFARPATILHSSAFQDGTLWRTSSRSEGIGLDPPESRGSREPVQEHRIGSPAACAGPPGVDELVFPRHSASSWPTHKGVDRDLVSGGVRQRGARSAGSPVDRPWRFWRPSRWSCRILNNPALAIELQSLLLAADGIESFLLEVAR